MGALAMHKRNDPRITSAPGRAASRTALDSRLLQEIDPENKLAPAERERRLEYARREHFTRLAYQRVTKAKPKKRKAARR